jgi:uncharacterized protein YndB with AHSA1/START domain
LHDTPQEATDGCETLRWFRHPIEEAPVIPDRISREIVIEAPPERVWAVLTEPVHLAQWFSDEVEIDTRPGGRVLFTWHGRGVLGGRVEAVEPPHRLAFRWTPGGEGELRENSSTLVEITLTPESGGRTRLRVDESGFQGLAGSDGDRAHHARENSAGWDRELDELREYVARHPVGDILDE